MSAVTHTALRDWITEARARSFALVTDLSDEQCTVPRMPIVTPFVWELAHVAWFQEKWVLRHSQGHAPIHANGDAMYDSANVPHPTRWDMDQLGRAEVMAYCAEVRDRSLAVLDDHEPDDTERYFQQLGVFHEDMHAEAFTYMRQTLGYSAPDCCGTSAPPQSECGGDVEVPGGRYRLGAERDALFAFDNEKWAHEVEIRPFRIARAAVTQQQFAAFIEDGGYERPELWTEGGWRWREETGARHPVYWRDSGGLQRRDFDTWVALEPELPVSHVTWFEADAFCRWAGRRLPTEAEWEVAAGGYEKRHFPWGDDDPDPANLGWKRAGCCAAGAHVEGESPFGCRQMLGNVWEWTSTTFEPFPGFVVDPYKEYSAPFFGTRKVLRGGSWATPARLIRNTWRNYFEPHRCDIISGFRTCALV